MIRRASVMSHVRPAETADAFATLLGVARDAGVELVLDREEASKHGVAEGDGVQIADDLDVDLCVVLGGDGTILKGLRRYAHTNVPVFAVNFGAVGFLATIDPEECAAGYAMAFAGECESLSLPAIEVHGPGIDTQAFNDVAIHRRAGERLAQLSYSVGEAMVARIRCDGLVVASPAGSTGYNLANGGPVMAWGVEGYVVSFIAPHSLTARPVVIAPNDELTISHGSDATMDVAVDGTPVGELPPGGSVTVGFARDAALLAQAPGSSFYRRLREKFGRLSN